MFISSFSFQTKIGVTQECYLRRHFSNSMTIVAICNIFGTFQMNFETLNARVCRGLLDPWGHEEVTEVGEEIGRLAWEGDRPSSERWRINGGRMRRWIAPALGKRHGELSLVRQRRRSDQMGYDRAQGGAEERQAERKCDRPREGVSRVKPDKPEEETILDMRRSYVAWSSIGYTGDHKVGQIATGRGEWCHIYF